MDPEVDAMVRWHGAMFPGPSPQRAAARPTPIAIFFPDVVVGVGFSGYGFKMAPAVGKFLAKMAINGKSSTAVEAGVELHNYRINSDQPNTSFGLPIDRRSRDLTILLLSWTRKVQKLNEAGVTLPLYVWALLIRDVVKEKH
ncbi:hypothetical protein HU200_039557 [Digitaria exilis]|uniref:FAD dependent oxidoreductase domain-containing protein n=1 Tax=Digitaria exilis TaxID=1010633 RepID=A0A835EI80_9POAL|nr:hypothetical protein HU200_039557 [Digitaria exilis]